MVAACREEEATKTLTPLEIPPRPKFLIETPTARALNLLRRDPSITAEPFPQEDTETHLDHSGRGVTTANEQETQLEVEGVEAIAESEEVAGSRGEGDVASVEAEERSGKDGLGEADDVQFDELQEMLAKIIGNPDEAEPITAGDEIGTIGKEIGETMIEAEIIVLDDETMDNKEISVDERLARRQLR